MHQAATAYQRGRWADAEALCRKVLTARRDYFEALTLLGIIAAQTRRTEEAADLLGRAVSAQPGNAAAHSNYGNVLQALKQFEEALSSYARALKINPDYAEAYYNRGDALQGLKRFEEALDSYQQALKIRPGYAEAYNNRGNALQALKRFEEALDSYQQALKIRPDFAEAYDYRGNALQALKRFEEALDSYERALKIRPDYAEAYYNRGNALQQLKHFEEALKSYAQALEIKPDFAEAYNNRGSLLQRLKRFEEALDNYARALQSNPDGGWFFGMWLLMKQSLCDWSNSAALIPDLISKIKQAKKVTTPFAVLSVIDDLALQRQVAETWISEMYPLSHALPPLGARCRRERIRIGYYSADFQAHATTHLMAGLFESQDRRRFELLAFSYGPDEHDDMRKRIGGAFDQFLDLRTKSDIEIARMSRDLGIDIAVDLKGFTQDARIGIFSYRAAPVQVSYLGYPGTIGAPYIDYLIADQTLIPPESRLHYAEKIVYLPHSYQVNDRKRPIADKVFTRAELGLPPTGFVFCCFNNNYKITPDVFDGWMRILRQVKGSVLWLLEDNSTAANNLRREAQAREVDAERLIFAQRMPMPEHLARHRAADLFIDTLPCNAHTSASDALWAGVPVLTRIGRTFAARVAASLLNAAGLPELIATTQEQYEAKAVELADDPGQLMELRERLRRNRLTMALFDTEQFAVHLESGYEQMYERYVSNLSPEHIYVER